MEVSYKFVRYHVLVSVFRLWYILVGFPLDFCFGRSEFGEKLVAYDVFLIMVHFNSIFFIAGFYFLSFFFFFAKWNLLKDSFA